MLRGSPARARQAASSASISAPTRIPPTAPKTMSRLIETFAAVASYFTVNVSSPNTPGLRDLQQADELDDLLAGAGCRCASVRDRRVGPCKRRC